MSKHDGGYSVEVNYCRYSTIHFTVTADRDFIDICQEIRTLFDNGFIRLESPLRVTRVTHLETGEGVIFSPTSREVFTKVDHS